MSSVRRSVLKTQIHSYTYVLTVCLHDYIKLRLCSFIICLFDRFISLVIEYVSLKYYFYLLPTCLCHWLSLLKLKKILLFILGFLCYKRFIFLVPYKYLSLVLYIMTVPSLCENGPLPCGGTIIGWFYYYYINIILLLVTTLKYNKKHCSKLKLICNSSLSVTYHIMVVDIGFKYYLLGGKRYIIQICYINVINGY